MSLNILLTCLLTALPTFITAIPISGLPAQACVGGHPHGSRVDMTDYWYICNNGHLLSRGCFAQNRRRLAIGERYVADGLETYCTVDTMSREAKLVHTGCVVNGELHLASEFWNDNVTNLWYFCESTGTALKLNFGGCVLDGDRIAKEMQVVRRGVIYNCFTQTADTEAGLRPIGCMYYAKRYNMGNTFQDEKFWYSCNLSENGLEAERVAMGCVYNDTRLTHGQKYIKDRVLYECQIADDKSESKHSPMGCVTEQGLKTIGQYWTVGKPPYRYQLQCQVTNKGETAYSVTTACAYANGEDEEVIIGVDCYRVVSTEAVACKRRKTDDALVYTIFDASQTQYANTDFGVTSCGLGESDLQGVGEDNRKA